jgi:hypothetical protein
MRKKEELENIAEDMLLKMPQDLSVSELLYILSLMVKGAALALREKGT